MNVQTLLFCISYKNRVIHTYTVNTTLTALCYCDNKFWFKMICFARFAERNCCTCTLYLFLDVYISRCISCLSGKCELVGFYMKRQCTELVFCVVLCRYSAWKDRSPIEGVPQNVRNSLNLSRAVGLNHRRLR